MVSAAAWQRSASLHPLLYQYRVGSVQTSDMWFDADIPRAACMMFDRLAPQHQVSDKHPLLPAALHLPAFVLGSVTDMSAVATIRIVAAIAGGVWTMVCYWWLRLLGSSTMIALAFAALASASASAVFWSAVPEAHIVAASTLLLPLIAAAHPRIRQSATLMTIASAASLSITVTGWMSGVAAAWRRFGWRYGTQVLANALAAVSLLWVVQALWFPQSTFFLGRWDVGDDLSVPRFTDLLATLAAIFSHSIVMPAFTISGEPGQATILSVQQSLPGTTGPIGVGATVCWAVMLGWGARQLLRGTDANRDLLVVVLCGQVALHLVFGDETFLFSPSFVPLLIGVASFAARGRNQPAVVVAVLLLTVSAGLNNARQFERAADMTHAQGSALTAVNGLPEPGLGCQGP